MSVVEQPEPTGVTVVSPTEALRLARPLPSAKDLTIKDLTIDEWQALMDAITEA